LSSEAEWEYACRAGTTTPFSFGETISPELANYNGNYTYGKEPKGKYRKKTTPVGSFPPNAFGLYDMHGNVWEWCEDFWHETYEGVPNDGSAWLTGGNQNLRVLRGGSWFDDPWFCRCANRDGYDPDFGLNFNGFRVVSSVVTTL
jgi:formylglycine-generating enzyme required for sulfatase activity